MLDVIHSPTFATHATWDSGFLSIASDVARGMAHIHFHKVLHRDLKPNNVLLDANWVAKVAAFGTVLPGAELQSGLSAIAGTPPYMVRRRGGLPRISTAHMRARVHGARMCACTWAAGALDCESRPIHTGWRRVGLWMLGA